jgi:GMP synthase (glutamine-hydrolysing)
MIRFVTRRMNASDAAPVPARAGGVVRDAGRTGRLMRILAVENYPNTGLGLVGRALHEAGAQTRTIRVHAGDAVPDSPAAYDGLILLGGTQDALDDANFPSLRQEMALARAFDDARKPVLGICLGAQILARAWGAENILGRPIEFGWHAVRPTPAGRADPVLSAIGDGAPLFHWHVDTFTLPPGAARLAESDATTIQAFRVGHAVYGIQFQFEAGTETVAHWTRCFTDEIEPFAPDWFERHRREAELNGGRADAAGLALANAWLGLVSDGDVRIRTATPRSGIKRHIRETTS